MQLDLICLRQSMQRVHLTSVFMYAERHLKEKEKGVEEGGCK